MVTTNPLGVSRYTLAEAIDYLEQNCSFWKIERSNGHLTTERLDVVVRLANPPHPVPAFAYAAVRQRQNESFLALVKRAVKKAINQTKPFALMTR